MWISSHRGPIYVDTMFVRTSGDTPLRSDSVRNATDNLRRRLSPEARFRPIQDELAGFFLREVINPKGEHYTEDEEIYMHTRD